MRSLGQGLAAALFKPVDAAGLVYFRIAFYTLMLWETWLFVEHNWVVHFYSEKDFYFTYWPFTFVSPWPAHGMTIHMYVMGLILICLVLGFCYRVSATVFFFMITYIFLLEKARYLNHFYLVCLLAFLMIFVPAHRDFSLDALRNPSWRAKVVPAWSIWLLRFQVGVPYFFGGIAKLHSDWLRGEPLRSWLALRTDLPFFGQFFTNESVVWLMTYGSLVLDLSVVFFLLSRRTRVFAYLAALAFHFMNARLFDIGIFPWVMIAATAVFFEPGWPRQVWRDLRQGHPFRTPAFVAGGMLGFFSEGLLLGPTSWMRAGIAAFGVAVSAYHLDEPFRQREEAEADRQTQCAGAKRREEPREAQSPIGHTIPLQQRWTLALLGLWVISQALIPLRHFVMPGNVHWTEEGHNFSWLMMVRQKHAEGVFVVTDPATGEQWRVNLWNYLTLRQQQEMISRPHMIVQFVHYLKGRLHREGRENVEIRARITVSLNSREPQLLIDPSIDLTKVPYPWWGHAPWILPLETPLPKPERQVR